MTEREILRINTKNSLETERIAEDIGKCLKGGEVIELGSDLGGGKTTFVRGLARGMGSADHVSSPTFKISNVYKAHNLELYHFDFYRLTEPGIVANELAEVINEPKAVIVVEWGQAVRGVLPKSRLTIAIKTTAETTRQIEIQYPVSLAYLVNGLDK